MSNGTGGRRIPRCRSAGANLGDNDAGYAISPVYENNPGSKMPSKSRQVNKVSSSVSYRSHGGKRPYRGSATTTYHIWGWSSPVKSQYEQCGLSWRPWSAAHTNHVANSRQIPVLVGSAFCAWTREHGNNEGDPKSKNTIARPRILPHQARQHKRPTAPIFSDSPGVAMSDTERSATSRHYFAPCDMKTDMSLTRISDGSGIDATPPVRLIRIERRQGCANAVAY